jgi:hypothetical protein
MLCLAWEGVMNNSVPWEALEVFLVAYFTQIFLSYFKDMWKRDLIFLHWL